VDLVQSIVAAWERGDYSSAEGKSRREALRCLKRHLARVFKLLREIASRSHPESENLSPSKGKDN
jgi:hypothetical protein